MTKYEKELSALAQQINVNGNLLRTLKINRRYGKYFIDAYSLEKGKLVASYYMGDFKETRAYLHGLVDAFWYGKPF